MVERLSLLRASRAIRSARRWDVVTRRQKTLRTAVEFSGVGLHSGELIHARILPAAPGQGVEFLRTDLPNSEPIPAHIGYYAERERRTHLRRGEAEVDTVEHFLSACAGMGVDNLTVELDGGELPGLDGSARQYVELFQQAGIVEQRQEARSFQLEQPVYVRQGDATVVALPSDKPALTLQYVAAFDEPGIPGGSFQCEVTADTYVREIELVLRLEGEPVRHKLLDLMGDLHLLGADLYAHVIATRSGHRTNAALVRSLLDLMQVAETGGAIRRESGLEVTEILRMLPHRYPFVLIDRVVDIDGYKRAVAVKNVSINEPFFQGHFPGRPLMPGVLQLEAMAQLAGVLLLRKLENTGKLAVLWAIDKVKLRGTVVPGDQLRIEVETLKMKGTTAQVRGTGTVAGKLVCEANLMFTMVDA